MRTIFTTLCLTAASMLFSTASAQEAVLPEKLDGFYRMTNAAFNEALTATSRYDLGATIPDAASAGSIFELKTGEMYTFAAEMEKLQQLLDEGKITQEEYTTLFMQIMNVNSWKSGFYPVTSLRTQGVDYVEMINKLPDYADAAIENFLNNEIKGIYEEYRDVLTLLCVFASDVINPSNLETEEAFRKWAENYLVKWRGVADFAIYLHPVYTTPPADDTETPTEPTGEYYFEFMTPKYVGSMEKAQQYINAILTDNGNLTDVETLDIWKSAVEFVLVEIAKDYPEGSDAYEFAKEIFTDTQMNALYVIGEDEEGGLSLLQLPDAFNTQGITITADDLARCTWKFEEVSEAQPFAVRPVSAVAAADNSYYSTLYTDFACNLLSPGMKGYYATFVDPVTGEPVLEEISGTYVPANTPVIIKSTSAELEDNKIMPVRDENPAKEDTALQGTLFAAENEGDMVSLCIYENRAAFQIKNNPVPANSAYVKSSTLSVDSLVTGNASEHAIYDIMGRKVKDTEAGGIYIIDGKKVIVWK